MSFKASRSGAAGPGPGTPSPEGQGLATLAQAALALRATGDLGTACAIACSCAVQALRAGESRLLRVDARSGALRLLEDTGVETPYLAEHGGPVERVMRTETASSRSQRSMVWKTVSNS